MSGLAHLQTWADKWLVVHRLGLQRLLYKKKQLNFVSCIINGANSSEEKAITVILIENGGARNLNFFQIWKFQYLNLSEVKRQVTLEDWMPYLCLAKS